MKILHVLETSLPNLAGYSIRSKYIVENQKKYGLEPVVITSPFFRSGDLTRKREIINGINYFRTNFIKDPSSVHFKILSYLVRYRMLQAYKKAVVEIAEAEKADIIHAHSSYTNGYAANYASRLLGIPFIYELRTLWGEAAVVEDNLRQKSLKYKMIWDLEVKAMKSATRLIAISQGIKDEIVGRGIDSSKVDIVPNGVDSNIFVPLGKCLDLANQHGLHGAFVLGYVGSIRKLEGLRYLIEAFRIMREKNGKVVLLIVGDGPERENLEKQVHSLHLLGVIFVGQVDHEKIRDYYSICDVLVFPRIRAKINQTVTPLKPLECMASGKVCLCSDVGGLAELVKDGYNGIIFRSEDPVDLAAKVRELMGNGQKYERLRNNSIDWIKKERDWRVLIPKYVSIYRAALDKRQS